jgi:hypothetical protein
LVAEVLVAPFNLTVAYRAGNRSIAKCAIACGGGMDKLGEDVTEVLDYIPGHFQVIRHAT